MSKIKTDDTNKKSTTFKSLVLITFFTALILIVATYAWLSSALNVKIKFFEMSVSSTSGLFISLDGVDFTESVNVSMDSIIMDLKKTYPNHTNQWGYGLWPVSSTGITDSNQEKFSMFKGELGRTRTYNPNGTIKRLLYTTQLHEASSQSAGYFISFDIFLKNVSGSPKPDNLYFDKNTYIDFDEGTTQELKEEMAGLFNSLRIGIVKIGSVPLKSDINTIQNMKCNNDCQMSIYEPNSKNHSKASIETAKNYGINLVDGQAFPTYAIRKEGNYLEHTGGQPGTGIALDNEHFALQKTMTDFTESLFQVPNAITKARVYFWVEGQDIDSLETYSKGASLTVFIDLVKDLAGYE